MILVNEGSSTKSVSFHTISDDNNTIYLYPNSSYVYIGNSCGFKLNSDKKSLIVKNVKSNLNCEIYFGKEIYKINLRDTTNTYEYISEVNPKDLYVSPKVGWYIDAGATTSISKITLPQIKGYLFKGYTNASGEEFINASGEIISGKTEIFSGNSTAKIKTTPITYKIEYNGNGATGGTTAASTHTYNMLSSLTLNGYNKTGYTFNGWNTQLNGSGTSYSNGQSVKNLSSVNNGIVTLYAKWKANTYAVTYNKGSATSGTLPSGQTATYNSNLTLGTNNMTKSNTDASTVTFNYNGSGAANTTAKVQKKYTANGWTTTSGSTTRSYTSGQVISPWTSTSALTLYPCFSETLVSPTFPTPTRTGYTFDGWYTEASGGTKVTSYTGSTAVTYYAHWNPAIYKITLNGNGANSAGSTVIYEKYNTGYYKDSACISKITSITIPKKDYNDFSGYSYNEAEIINASGSISASSTKFTADTTISASWKARTCNVTLSTSTYIDHKNCTLPWQAPATRTGLITKGEIGKSNAFDASGCATITVNVSYEAYYSCHTSDDCWGGQYYGMSAAIIDASTGKDIVRAGANSYSGGMDRHEVSQTIDLTSKSASTLKNVYLSVSSGVDGTGLYHQYHGFGATSLDPSKMLTGYPGILYISGQSTGYSIKNNENNRIKTTIRK